MNSDDLGSRKNLYLLIDELSKLLDAVKDRYLTVVEAYIKNLPPVLSTIFLGRDLSSVYDLTTILDNAVKFSVDSKAPIRGLAILSVYELRALLNVILSKSSVNPMGDSEARTYAFKLISGAAPGLLIVVGDDPLALEKLLSRAQRLGFVVFVVSRRFREVLDSGLVIDGRRGLIRYVSDDPIDGLIYSIGLAVRLLSISIGSLSREDLPECLQKRIRLGIVALLTSDRVEDVLDAISDLGICTVVSSDVSRDIGGAVYVDRVEDILPAVCGRLGITVVMEEELPIGFSSIYEGKSVRDRDVYVEFGNVKPYFELVVSRRLEEVADGYVEVVGADIDSMSEGSVQPLGILVEVAGVRMKSDYEPVIERSIHRIVNYGEETWHVGQRDSGWIRITRRGFDRGFRLKHL
ncbi:MAG: hypothetical protein QXQ29_06675, partial [Candidatus Bathyarchaeia archaeon]